MQDENNLNFNDKYVQQHKFCIRNVFATRIRTLSLEIVIFCNNYIRNYTSNISKDTKVDIDAALGILINFVTFV